MQSKLNVNRELCCITHLKMSSVTSVSLGFPDRVVVSAWKHSGPAPLLPVITTCCAIVHSCANHPMCSAHFSSHHDKPKSITKHRSHLQKKSQRQRENMGKGRFKKGMVPMVLICPFRVLTLPQACQLMIV